MLDIVDAVATIHDVIEKSEQISGLDTNAHFGGHFDIKPINILVERREPDLRLVLTDFEQAAANEHGDSNYAPPEIFFSGATPAKYLKPAYDVWSLACVLLKCIIFMEGGARELELFTDKLRDSNNCQNLWEGATALDVRLLTVVRNQLDRLHNQADTNTKNIVVQIQSMLGTTSENRPTVRDCLMVFARADSRRGDLHGRDHMDCGLENWRIASTTNSQSRVPVPLRLSLYRDSKQPTERTRPERIFIYINGEDGASAPYDTLHFQPLAFYNRPDECLADESFKCRFDTVLQARTFHFTRLDQFLDFMTLITRQRILPINDPEQGLRIAFKSAILKRRSHVLDSTEEFESGNLQVWKQLGESEYDVGLCIQPSDYGHLTGSIETIS
jgi:serine/threonine protein kinase